MLDRPRTVSSPRYEYPNSCVYYHGYINSSNYPTDFGREYASCYSLTLYRALVYEVSLNLEFFRTSRDFVYKDD